MGDDMGESRCQFSEAGIDSAWYQAIERRDCKTLMRLLDGEEGSALWKGTGKAGRTVLHVAAIQGSVELVRILKNVLKFGNFDLKKTILELMDGRCDMTAVGIAESIVGYKDIELLWEDENLKSFESVLQWKSEYSLTEREVRDLRTIMDALAKCSPGQGLMKSFEENVDYNFCDFEVYGCLFLFHHACSRLDGQEFVKNVLTQCEYDTAERLLTLRDFQGRTPVHVAVAVAHQNGLDEVLGNLIVSLREDIGLPLGVRNGRGWSSLHLAATQPYSAIYRKLVQDWRLWDVLLCRNKPMGLGCCYVLYLAVVHNNVAIFRDLMFIFSSSLNRAWVNVNEVFEREIINDGVVLFKSWTLFSMAMVLGHTEILDILMQYFLDEFKEDQKRMRGCAPPLICLAASLGNTEILRMCMDRRTVDPLEEDYWGRTPLHYAANGLIEPTSLRAPKFKRPQTCVCVEDVPNVAWVDELWGSLPQEARIEQRNSGRKGCINMLLQAGVDIWQKDHDGKIASIGRGITDDDFISWWHEKMAKETLDMRNNLNQGGNAISVIGALIATASYVGPLQPPLTYGSDPLLLNAPNSDSMGYARVWYEPVKIFMVSNSLSFYLAIASIMLAVVPSLPMPQQALLNELERTRKTVASAICVLLLSVVGILISYAAASIAVMPSHNVGLTSYPALVGGCACLIGIVLFMVRVARLMFPNWCRWFGRVFRGACSNVFKRACGICEICYLFEPSSYLYDVD